MPREVNRQGVERAGDREGGLSDPRMGPFLPGQVPDDISAAYQEERRRNSFMGRLGRTIGGLGERITQEIDQGLLRKVSLLGVDPRSTEGQQILDLLLMQVPANSPDVMALVEEYQSRLIGPLSKRTTAPGTVQGPFTNQYGYQAGDEFRELDNLSTEYLARIQERMSALGMLDSFIPGRKDQKTVAAFKDLMHLANAEGTSWIVQLADLEKMKEEMGEDWPGASDGTGGAAPFVADTYLAPDYATLAQTVKDKLRSELGRDPDESELALLTAELAGWDREAFDVEEAARRSEYDAAIDEGRDVPGEGQDIDPVARFKESFEQKFAAELQGIERTEEAAETSENVRGAVSRLSQMSGGMG